MRIIPPYTAASDEGYKFFWGSLNSLSIARGSHRVFHVEGGVAPYTWVLTDGTDFAVESASTAVQNNNIYAIDDATVGSEDTVTVTDAEGSTASGLIKCCTPIPCCSENDTAVVLLLQSDTTHGSQTFVDTGLSAGSPHVLTIDGGAPIHSTTQKKIGASSLYFNGSSWLGTVHTADWDFGIADFCLDFWIFTTQNVAFAEMFGRFTAGLATWAVGAISGDLYLYSVAAGSVLAGSLINDGAWHHCAIVRYSGTLSLYIDGDLKNSADWTGINLTGAEDLAVGWSGRNAKFVGYMDQIRLSKGNARFYDDFFTPLWPYVAGVSGYSFSWGTNPTTVPYNSYTKFTVVGGCPPYLWEVVGNTDVEWVAPNNNSPTNILYCPGGEVDLSSFELKVTDACGTIVSCLDPGGAGSEITLEFSANDGGACCSRGMAWYPGPSQIGQSSVIVVSFEGGCGPYTMTLDVSNGLGFWADAIFSKTVIMSWGKSFAIYSDATVCGVCTVTIRDKCLTALSSLILSSVSSQWVLQPGNPCAVDCFASNVYCTDITADVMTRYLSRCDNAWNDPDCKVGSHPCANPCAAPVLCDTCKYQYVICTDEWYWRCQ